MADPRFRHPLDLEYIDGHQWKVLSAFDYYTDVPPVPVISVPVGFVTDFASIPRPLWNVFSPTGTYGKAAVIHDTIYRTATLPVTRAGADAIFLEAMTALSVNWVTRNILYRGVRIFGASSYAPRRQEKSRV